MNKWERLFAQAREKLVSAKALLESDNPDMAAVKALQDEAARLKSQAEALKAVDVDLGDIAQPTMPGPLPMGGDGNSPPQPAGPDATKAFNSAYTIRYGTPAAEVKAVLTDLHGPQYETKRWAQWGAFNRYLRGGVEKLKSGDHELLREIIMTPAYAEQAIKTGLDIYAIKAVMVEAQDELGGYVVPVDWQARVIERLAGLTVMRRAGADIMQTSRDSVEMPKSTGGDSQYSSNIRVTWVDETPTAGTAATNLTFGSEKIPVHTAMGEVFLSRNLVEDSAFDLAGYLSRKFAESGAMDEDNQFLVGDGHGKPQGLLPDSANDLGLSTANSGHASALTWDGLIDLIYTPDSQYRNRCVFIGEKATFKAVAKLKDGNGQYLWRDRFGNNVSEGGELTRLMGYGTFEQEAMPTIASSAYPMLFGDPSGYLIVDRIGMVIERFIDSSTARINQVCYVMRRRLGGKCVEPWRWAAQYVSA